MSEETQSADLALIKQTPREILLEKMQKGLQKKIEQERADQLAKADYRKATKINNHQDRFVKILTNFSLYDFNLSLGNLTQEERCELAKFIFRKATPWAIAQALGLTAALSTPIVAVTLIIESFHSVSGFGILMFILGLVLIPVSVVLFIGWAESSFEIPSSMRSLRYIYYYLCIRKSLGKEGLAKLI